MPPIHEAMAQGGRPVPAPSKRTADWKDPLYRARTRVYVVDTSNINRRLSAVFNPQALHTSIKVNVGRLAPVGGSSPVKMYGSTGEKMVNGLEFYFSTGGILRFKDHNVDSISKAVKFFTSFCYGAKKGVSPHPILIAWKDMGVRFALDEIDVTYSMFDRALNLKVAKITVTGGAISTRFISSGSDKSNAGTAKSGGSLNLAGASVSDGWGMDLGSKWGTDLGGSDWGIDLGNK